MKLRLFVKPPKDTVLLDERMCIITAYFHEFNSVCYNQEMRYKPYCSVGTKELEQTIIKLQAILSRIKELETEETMSRILFKED